MFCTYVPLWSFTTLTSLGFIPRPQALISYHAQKPWSPITPTGPLFPAKTISLGFLPDPQALVSNCAYKPWFLTGQQALVSYNAHKLWFLTLTTSLSFLLYPQALVS